MTKRCSNKKTTDKKTDKKFVFLKNGTKVEVSDEIYKAYYRPQWREEKRQQRDAKSLLSLDYEYEIDGEISTLADYIPDKRYKEQQEQRKKEMLLDILHRAMSALREESEEDYTLIDALFFQGKSERQYSDEIGIPRATINYRRNRILKRLLKDMQEQEKLMINNYR